MSRVPVRPREAREPVPTSRGRMIMRSWLIPSLLIAFPAALLLGASSPTGRDPSSPVPAAGIAPVPGLDVLPVLQRAQEIGPADGTQLLTLAVSLPFAHP